MQKPVVDHELVVQHTIIMVHEFALDPDELGELTQSWSSDFPAAVVLDGMGEVEFHYSSGWKSLFTEEEQVAVERYIATERYLPVIEDQIWDEPSLANKEWQTLRAAARNLITALGGLPKHLRGNWATK